MNLPKKELLWRRCSNLKYTISLTETQRKIEKILQIKINDSTIIIASYSSQNLEWWSLICYHGLRPSSKQFKFRILVRFWKVKTKIQRILVQVSKMWKVGVIAEIAWTELHRFIHMLCLPPEPILNTCFGKPFQDAACLGLPVINETGTRSVVADTTNSFLFVAEYYPVATAAEPQK